jgi:large subunit ribosomal protein L4
MKIELKDSKGNAAGDLEVAFSVIENGKGTQAVHDVVVAYQAAQRSGTACTKTVGDVAGSGKKLWRQKGTGRARTGQKRSPIWRGGGVAHGPKPRDFRKTVTKSTRQLALRKALSERLKMNDVIVVDDLQLDAPKTKQFLSVLAALGLDPKKNTVQVVVDGSNDNVALAARNIARVSLTTGDTLNTYDVLRSDKLVFSKAAFEKVTTRVANK